MDHFPLNRSLVSASGLLRFFLDPHQELSGCCTAASRKVTVRHIRMTCLTLSLKSFSTSWQTSVYKKPFKPVDETTEGFHYFALLHYASQFGRPLYDIHFCLLSIIVHAYMHFFHHTKASRLCVSALCFNKGDSLLPYHCILCSRWDAPP